MRKYSKIFILWVAFFFTLQIDLSAKTSITTETERAQFWWRINADIPVQNGFSFFLMAGYRYNYLLNLEKTTTTASSSTTTKS